MRRRAARLAAGGVIASAVLLSATSVQAAGAGHPVDLPSQDLATALRQLAAREHVDLLFDAARMAGRHSAAVRGAPGAMEAVKQLLAGTGFVARRGDFGEILIIPGPAPPPPSAARSADGGGASAVAELLVVGERSLNTAIRRSEDDIQPYAVFSSEALAAAQDQTVEEFLRTRDPGDAQAGTLSQAPVANAGAVRSRIDLGGLGPAQTLVLVDGRRLPSIPGQDIFQQADLNGIPLFAIDRVETLTSTAGGIYGPGATGGVVNIVLKRNYDGGQLGVSGGLADRGDAGHWRVDGAWGRSFFGGKTQVMLAFSHAEDAGLTQGQRDIALAARRLLVEGDLSGALLISPSLNVQPQGPLPGQDWSHDGPTFKPLNQTLANGGLAALAANDGLLDANLSADGQGTMQSLLSRTRRSSVVFSLRQEISPRIDAFVDVLYLRDQGWAVGPRTQPTRLYVGADGLNEPFENGATVSFPTPGLFAVSSDDVRTLRATTGAIVRLGRGWSGELDLTYGRSSDRQATPALPQVDPSAVADLDLFNSGVDIASLWPSFGDDNVLRQVNTLVDVNLRLSGPVFTLPAGQVTATLLGEYRREHQPNAYATFTYFNSGAIDYYSIGPQTQTVGSAYGELRAPLLRKDVALWPLRGLELQLAGRVDDESATAPADAFYFTDDRVLSGRPFTGRARTFAFTAGLRVFPLDGLMLRASIATGWLPPTTAQLVEGVSTIPVGSVPYAFDPKRNNAGVGQEAPFTFQWNGSPTLQPEHARTISAGLVLTPAWASGLRVAVDYTRIDKTHEITDFADVDFQFFLDHENQFPGRVTRAPLTADDIAAGYTGGVVTDIDTTPLNIGRSIVQTVDLDASYQRDTRLGHLRFYLRATWEPDFRRKDDPDYGLYQTAGHIDGPLALRGSGGVAWSSGRWRADLNVQAYGRYDVTLTNRSFAARQQSNANFVIQGGAKVPAQAYVDLEIAYEQALPTAPAGLKSVEYRLGVHNLFDTRPPLLLIDNTTAQPVEALYYSPYGDPRGRRIEASVIGRF